MDKTTNDFEDWFGNLQVQLAERGVNFNDRQSVKRDFEDGKDVHDVIDEIAAEYDEGD